MFAFECLISNCLSFKKISCFSVTHSNNADYHLLLPFNTHSTFSKSFVYKHCHLIACDAKEILMGESSVYKQYIYQAIYMNK